MKLIYFSPVPWDSFTQRPHEFVDYFNITTSTSVVWVEPYPTRLPQLTDFFRLKNRERGTSREIPAWLTVLPCSGFPVEPVKWLRFLNFWFYSKTLKNIAYNLGDIVVIGKPSLLALSALDRFHSSYFIYDAMDDFPQFYSGISAKSMAEVELKISKKVSKVLVSSTNLKKKFGEIGVDSQLVLNACSLISINKMKAVHRSEKARTVVGYIGTIAQWFDWELVIILANHNRDVDFHLIGPIMGHLPANLPTNISIFPSVNHEKAMHLMAQFSVGMIPFKRSELTHCVDPIKYYEYKAFGLPIISTDFGEMSYRKSEKGVYVIETNFASLALDIKSLDRTDSAQVCSWQDRFSAVI